MFILHENFNDKPIILDKKEFLLLLNPIEELRWFILIPKIENLKNILDFSNEKDYIKIQKIILKISSILDKKYKPTQLNIATLGNITPQLHYHLILRNDNDKFWPNSPFDKEFTKIIDKKKISDLIPKYKLILEV